VTSLQGFRILIAEDEGLVALQLEDIVRGLGCEVVGPVSRLDELTAAIEAKNFDGALLDVNLRGEHVFEILPRLEQLDIPFIITSGYDAKSLFPLQYRDVPRLAKPFDEAGLRQICLQIFVNPNPGAPPLRASR
jgi:CheY-like chemotaxis protein